MDSTDAQREAHYRDLQAKLTEQAREISRLSDELRKGYQRQAGYFGEATMTSPEVKTELDRRQKKIWYLEAELRKTRSRLSARPSVTEALGLTTVTRRTRRALGRAQRKYRGIRQRGQA